MIITQCPDHNQPWLYNNGSNINVVDRNLCTPTAFSSQLRCLFNFNAIFYVPNGNMYPQNAMYYEQGWKDYMYDLSILSSQPHYPTNTNEVNTLSNAIFPSFSWWFNTNDKGANNMPSSVVGTTISNAFLGAQNFYSHTILQNWGYMRKHNTMQIVGTFPMQGTTPIFPDNDVNTLKAIEHSIQVNRSVILFLDSYSITELSVVGSAEHDSAEHKIYNINENY